MHIGNHDFHCALVSAVRMAVSFYRCRLKLCVLTSESLA